MSNHHEGDSKSFTLPAFLAFALVFCLFVLMSNCSGPYVPYNAHGGDHATEHKTNATEHKANATEHTSTDSSGSAHKSGDTSIHKTETHSEEHH